jgi:hypothetical protein
MAQPIPKWEPGDILDRKEVARTADGRIMEWRLIVDEEGDDFWCPFLVDADSDNVIETPSFMPLPGSQNLFLSCPIFEALYEGTRGPGKTLTLLMDFAKDVGKGYGKSWRGILFRRTYGDLDDVVKKIEEFFPKMFPGFRFLKSKSEYRAEWPTGEALLLRSMERVEDYDEYHGHEYPWIGFEELTQWEDDEPYLKMFSCCRSTKRGIPLRVRATTNPYGVGHTWVKKRFQLPGKRGKVIRLPGEMPRVAIFGNLSENFIMLHEQPHYPTILINSAKNPALQKAWLNGDWDVTSGGMVDDVWDTKHHVVPNFPFSKVPRGWTITRSYDHGQSSPFSVGWFLESNGEPIVLEDGRVIGPVRGDLILWEEWYGTNGEPNKGVNMATSKIAAGIKDREKDLNVWGKVHFGPADTQIWTKDSSQGTHGHGPSDDFEAADIFFDKADKGPGSRKRGWEVLRTRLEGAVPGKDGTRENPGLFVCERCVYWLEHVPVMPRDAKDPDEVPEKYEDHDADMTRYRLSWVLPGMFRQGGAF